MYVRRCWMQSSRLCLNGNCDPSQWRVYSFLTINILFWQNMLSLRLRRRASMLTAIVRNCRALSLAQGAKECVHRVSMINKLKPYWNWWSKLAPSREIMKKPSTVYSDCMIRACLLKCIFFTKHSAYIFAFHIYISQLYRLTSSVYHLHKASKMNNNTIVIFRICYFSFVSQNRRLLLYIECFWIFRCSYIFPQYSEAFCATKNA